MERGPKPRLGGDTLEGSKPADAVRSKKRAGILAVGALAAVVAGHSAEAGERGRRINLATEIVFSNDKIYNDGVCHLPGKEGETYIMNHPTSGREVAVPPGGFFAVTYNLMPVPRVFVEGPGYYGRDGEWIPCYENEIGKSFLNGITARSKENLATAKREWGEIRKQLSANR